jgi:hypothetical protein
VQLDGRVCTRERRTWVTSSSWNPPAPCPSPRAHPSTRRPSVSHSLRHCSGGATVVWHQVGYGGVPQDGPYQGGVDPIGALG